MHSFKYFDQKGEKTEKEFIQDQFVTRNYDHIFEKEISPDKRIERKEFLMHVIEERKSDYISNNANITLLTQLLTAFLVLGVLILFYDPTEFQMPFVEVTIPATLFHLFIGFGMVYLWIQFGLALNTGVDGRLALHFLIQEVEQVDGNHLSIAYSEVHTLIDKGIIDAWCHWYYRIFDLRTHGRFHDFISWIGLYLVYGGFWGAIHAVAIMLSTTIYEKKRSKRGGKLILLLFIATLILLVAATVTFIVEFEHASRLIAVSWFINILILFYWIKWGRDVAAAKVN